MRWIFGVVGGLIALIVISYFWAEWRLAPLDDDARAQAPGAFLELPDGQLHYRWEGPIDGDIVVLVHGFSTPNFIYDQNVAALNAAGFRTLRFDHFGRGWSDRPARKYTVDFYDETLLALLDSQGITEPIGLIGLSMGGPIVAEFAGRHPTRVRQVTLLVPAGLDLPDNAAATLLSIPGFGDWLWRLIGRDILLGDPQYDEARLAPENRLAGDVSAQMQYRGYLDALLSSLRHMPMVDRDATFETLAATNIPTLAIYGDADTTVLVSSAAKLRTLMPDADIQIIPNGTHGLNYQRHAEVNPMLIAALTASLAPNVAAD